MLFHYQDSTGAITRRDVQNPKDDGIYIHGYDLTTKSHKTFRKDRILSEFTDNTDPQFLAISSSAGKINRITAAHADFLFEICFTGFPEAERKELSALAEKAKLKVCKSVTVNLHFLCAGATAGPKKMMQAEDKGTLIITKDEFLELVEHGVMPEGFQPRDKFILQDKKGNAHALIDPVAFFSDWKFKPKELLWGAASITPTSRLGSDWAGRKLYAIDPELMGVQEGDVFYFGSEDEGIQVVFVGDGIEVMHFNKTPSWSATGYLVTQNQLIDWLKSGNSPPQHCQINKNQSKNKIAQFYEYTE